MINDEELQRFYHWLQAKGDDPSVVLALRWIAEFETYAEQDEKDFRYVKAMAQRRAPYDPKAAVALEVITWVEETVDPDPRLKRFHTWLQAKGDDPTAVLARWWLAEFEEAQEEGCPQTALMPTVH